MIEIKNFSGRYKINEEYRPIAAALVAKYRELKHVDPNTVLFVDDTTGSGLSKGRRTYARTMTIPERWQQVIYQFAGQRFTHCVELCRNNMGALNRGQLVALIYHELRHIDPDGGIRPHDVEDWGNMLEAFGYGWVHDHIPNLLDDHVNWDRILEPGLFSDQAKLTVVK